MTIHVYVGPTLSTADIRLTVTDAIVHDPVQHGDLLKTRFAAGDCVVMIDGYYHQAGAVRHKEILQVLDSGAAVIGAGSMGAIRAAEMYPLGMIGIGEVFRQYREGEITGDDEVAVAHGEGPHFRRFSDALVNIRFAIRQAQRAGLVEAEGANGLLRHARSLPYSTRSWAAIEHKVKHSDPVLVPVARQLRDYARANNEVLDLKAQDARLALEYAASGQWRSSLGPLDWRVPRWWHTQHLHDWRAQFGGEPGNGRFVSDLAAARYLQLHDPGFPGRWRTFVLGRIGQSAAGGLERAALDRAAAQGIRSCDLNAKVESFWLTESEQQELGEDEKLLVILVRSYRSSRGQMEILDAASPGLNDRAIRDLVADHHAVNDEIAAEAPHWQLSHLNHDILAQHLTDLWDTRPPDHSYLEAEARDRGFASFNSAVESFRPFFLRRYLKKAGIDGQPS